MDLWSKVLLNISEEISKPSFDTWLSGTIAKIDDHVITVIAKNKFAADWLKYRYENLISKTVKELTDEIYDFKFSYIGEEIKFISAK